MLTKKISVLGCGWLGLPLAEELVRLGYKVNGSTTTHSKIEELRKKGIQPFLLSFPENSSKTALAEFLEADVLVFNLPPSKIADTYEQLLATVLDAAPACLKHILFISSTSVYPDLNREVTEIDAEATPNASSLLLRCEHLVQQKPQLKPTVVRFGGLMGGNRHPGRWMAGKTDVPQPEAPVNMIHLADCVKILVQIIQQEKWGFTFNACAPEHPSRKVFYTKASLALGLTPPQFATQQEWQFKRINSGFLQQELHYQFIYSDPLTCLSSPEF
ncbi:SDR family oxidoreductase [Rufibacter roseus]|uniref:SDR family oxidoreductase n=1 Tax=Rufibacter roseus TaxID=1567108 RepID=A0ABW2DTX9_9BACT|nr:SDR family oxidoreductase [Rufibacter roseus]